MTTTRADLPPSEPLQQALRARAGKDRWMPFVAFMDIALYEPGCGYYTADRARVGRADDRDFTTAAAVGPVFDELVVASLVELLGQGDPQDFTLVEVGVEPGQDSFASVAMPFGRRQRLCFGDPLEIPPRAVVFANELLDAQPCVRLRFEGGAWRELAVRLTDDDGLETFLAPELSREAREVVERLPAEAPEGYHFDYAQRAETLLELLVSQPWEGVFLTLDYGKTWPELLAAVPQGTARAYYRQRQTPDLLARAGEQDLTSEIGRAHV